MYKEYFKEIFETSKSVIVPGLGSFSKTSPDDPKITFNPYLKFNDGFLAGFIAKKQGISIDDAGKMIADNVDKINYALDQSGQAIVQGLGMLKKVDGKLEFVPDTSAGANVTPPPAAKPVEPPKVEPPKPEVKPEIKPEAPKPEVKPVVEPPKVEPPKQENKPIDKNISVKVDAPGLTNVSDTSAKDKNTKKEKEKKVKPPKPPKPPRPEGEKKKKKFPLVWIIVLALLAGGGTFAAIQWDMVKGWLGMDGEKEVAKTEETKKEPEPAKEDTAAVQPIDTAAVTSEEPVVTTEEPKPVKETVKPVVHHSTSSGNFHVIVNCFSSEQNAGRMVEKLNAEGHQGNNLGQRGGFYMVEAGSFSSMEEAKSKLEAIKSTYPKAWIYSGS